MEALNQEVKQWSQQSAAMMAAKVRMLTNQNKHQLLKAKKGIGLAKSIKYKNLMRFGNVERIVFPFAKHGYFFAVGASRGHKAKTNPRKKVDWYNFVFEDRFEKLADIVVRHYGDEAALKASDLK
ncbi:MAG: hypothetical protein P1P88_04735 [Bacteroidales bacterium]|nr:hypothetical protein [Bacteroidales bacterium]